MRQRENTRRWMLMQVARTTASRRHEINRLLTNAVAERRDAKKAVLINRAKRILGEMT